VQNSGGRPGYPALEALSTCHDGTTVANVDLATPAEVALQKGGWLESEDSGALHVCIGILWCLVDAPRAKCRSNPRRRRGEARRDHHHLATSRREPSGRAHCGHGPVGRPARGQGGGAPVGSAICLTRPECDRCGLDAVGEHPRNRPRKRLAGGSQRGCHLRGRTLPAPHREYQQVLRHRGCRGSARSAGHPGRLEFHRGRDFHQHSEPDPESIRRLRRSQRG